LLGKKVIKKTAPDLGSGSLGSEGSTPFARTILNLLFILKEIADLLRKHGGKTAEELKAEEKK